MTPRAMLDLIERYEANFAAANVPKIRINPARTFQSLSVPEILAHAHHICDGVKEYAKDPERIGKANSHLTVVQMCLSFAGWHTLQELLEHNTPPND